MSATGLSFVQALKQVTVAIYGICKLLTLTVCHLLVKSLLQSAGHLQFPVGTLLADNQINLLVLVLPCV